MTVVLRAGAATDVGRMRTINQDSFALQPDRGLYIVADGMGGHQGGEVASRLAIETIELAYQEPTPESLADALAVANHRIHTQAADDPDLRGMGTTVVAAVLLDERPAADGSAAHDEEVAGTAADEADEPDDGPGQLIIANVGDSRAYLFRDGELIQLTEDHSLVADLVREGRITAQEAEVHPQRNIVTRVLGVYEHVDVDLWPLDPVVRDRVLLCSDGLFNEVGDDQISAVLRRLDDPQEAAEDLVRLANEAGGRDNITVVVLDVIDDGGVAQQASAALASAPSSLQSERDMAGFGAPVDGELSEEELDGVRTPEPASRKQRRADARARRKAARQERSRLSWRAIVFTLLVLAVIGGAVATVQWYGTSTYYVGFEGDEVVIFQGRPGGVLWIEPTPEYDTDIQRDEVPDRYLDALAAGREQSSLAEAHRYVSNIERDIIEAHDAEATTTTTTATTTTAAGTG